MGALLAFARRRRTALTIGGSIVVAGLLAALLADRRDEFATALSSASAWMIAVTAALQVVALVARRMPAGPDAGRG